MRRPNLFRHATSELSQDALLAWMLEWLNYDDEDMNAVSRNFVEIVLGVRPNWDGFAKVTVRRQSNKIDVLAILEMNETLPVVIAIEDKKDAPASNPFEKYQKAIEQQLNLPGELSGDRFHFVILRTRYDFAFIPPAGWRLATFRDMNQWIDAIRDRSIDVILEDWLDANKESLARLAGLEQRVREALDRPLANENESYNSEWSKWDFQFEFMRQLFGIPFDEFLLSDESKPQQIYPFRASYATDLSQSLRRGTSAGRQWVQMWFDPANVFFYRLDWLRGRWVQSAPE